MSNGNAEKYFRVFDEYSNQRPNYDDSIKRVINKIRRNVMQGPDNKGSNNQSGYKPPQPERTISSKEESLDDVVKKVKGIPSKSSSKGSDNESNSYSQSSPGSSFHNPRANPIKYAVGEMLGAVREKIVEDSLNPSYFPVVRDLAIRLLGKPTGWSDELLKEILAIGGHIFLDGFLRKK